ncbi:hypothetical protein F4775DRAFT_602752 [Biscogniauxia sp. FL1348]|nr:hypothetical protein F4775DRAFT_602752 [Biscogniauxia sp. FL1348]
MAIIPVLNHAIVLVPYEFLENPPLSAREVFHLTPAGRQSDDEQTRSLRAHFKDGTYLEFIAFLPDTDPEARSKHRYGECEEGTVVDWAIRFVSDVPGRSDANWRDMFDAMQLRVRDSGTGVIYTQPEDAGRDMVVAFSAHGGHLEWRRELDMVPGEVPYWVLLRSDARPTAAADEQHPSRAAGLAAVEVRIRAAPERVRSEHRLGLLWETFQTLFGREPVDVVDEGRQIDTWEWPVGAPGEADHEPVQRLVRLASPRDMARNVEVSVDLFKERGEVVRLELDGERPSFEMRLGPRPPLVNYRQNYHWEWMR